MSIWWSVLKLFTIIQQILWSLMTWMANKNTRIPTALRLLITRNFRWLFSVSISIWIYRQKWFKTVINGQATLFMKSRFASRVKIFLYETIARWMLVKRFQSLMTSRFPNPEVIINFISWKTSSHHVGRNDELNFSPDSQEIRSLELFRKLDSPIYRIQRRWLSDKPYWFLVDLKSENCLRSFTSTRRFLCLCLWFLSQKLSDKKLRDDKVKFALIA